MWSEQGQREDAINAAIMGHLYQETPKQKSWLANGLFIVFGATLFYILTLENDINQSNNYFIFVPPKTYQDQGK